MNTYKKSQGWIAWLILGIIATVATAAGVIVGVSNTPSGSAPPPSGICYTSCAIFVETECGTGKHMGACFGWWECPAALSSPGSGGSSGALTTGVGAHECID